MLYVYGIVRAGHPPVDPRGVGRPPGEVRLVESGPIAAPVSEVPDDFAVDEADARAHVHVLIELLSGGPVIPLRLGTVAPDDAAVHTEVLDPVRAEMVTLLDELDGLVELHVDADDDEAEAIAAVAASAPRPADGSDDLGAKLELGEAVASLLTQQRQRLAEAIVGRLRPLAVRDVPRSVIEGPEDPVLRWAFLVQADDVVNFDEAVIGIRSEYPSMSIRYVGPLPPAHFVEWDPQAPENADSFRGGGNWGW
jgi:gas vesicle protein GvpL/GvpF